MQLHLNYLIYIVNEPIESDSASNNRNGDDNLQANLDEGVAWYLCVLFIIKLEVESKDEYFSEEAADEIILNENKEDGEEADDIMEGIVFYKYCFTCVFTYNIVLLLYLIILIFRLCCNWRASNWYQSYQQARSL